VDDRGVAEADVHTRRPGDPVESAIERRQPVFPRLLGTRLHVGLVNLYDIGTGGKQILDLEISPLRVIHRGVFVTLVEVVLRLLATFVNGTGKR